MGRAQEPGGDYGYDLVHEDLQAAAGQPDPERADAAPQPGQPETSGDYGYDEAHDF